ncbi:hypothetical protein [Labrys wisconsinensis]|uniref:Uncharacterized protein n=1 Tax=Labrys wisconsinensis TaxID=425677 RepID=A0ABU0JEE7_9HYPH|nr:hypothetical protein [Labrys wisconsinensis]MDQ0472645.1 hypothetical protein [Labrys wisconsinensis]
MRRSNKPDGSTDYRSMITCFLCRGRFQHGQHVYDGRLQSWNEAICKRCEAGNWDDIISGTFPHLEQSLAAKGMPVALNSKGWINIPQ